MYRKEIGTLAYDIKASCFFAGLRNKKHPWFTPSFSLRLTYCGTLPYSLRTYLGTYFVSLKKSQSQMINPVPLCWHGTLTPIFLLRSQCEFKSPRRDQQPSLRFRGGGQLGKPRFPDCFFSLCSPLITSSLPQRPRFKKFLVIFG